MTKTDTIVWIEPEQVHSESVSRAICNQGNASALPRPSPQPAAATITEQQRQLQADARQSRTTWGVWEEVQSWRGALNRPTPLIVQRCQEHGLHSAALFFSLLLSVFPPSQAPSSGDHIGVYHIPHNLPKPSPFSSSSSSPFFALTTPPDIVLQRGLRSELEEQRGLAVLHHDPIWEEHTKRLAK